MTEKNSYVQLSEHMKELKLIENSMQVLGWDMRTYMPPKGIQQRAEMLGFYSKLHHERLVSEFTSSKLKEIGKMENLNDIQKRNLELWQRDYEMESKLPVELVQKLSIQENITEKLWEKAKVKSSFKMVQPELEKLFELIKQKANAYNPDKPMYDVLLDLFEKNITQDMINNYFFTLKSGVLKIVEKCNNSSVKPDANSIKIKASLSQQRQLSKFIMKFIGMDPERSRIDETAHPFTTGYADDVRITTHYLENEPMASFYAVMHEGGHSLYEMGFPTEHLWTGIGNSASYGIHESQSRFIENMIGKSPEFITYVFPKIQEIIPEYKTFNLVDFIRAVNAVTPSKIRVYADEVTYNLHIIMRYEIERDLFTNKVSISELPQVWEEKMDKYFGLKLNNEAEGVLQDIHWYGGAFGYFPAYALGNVYDGPLLSTMEKTIPDWKQQLREGNCKNMIEWLDVNVHKKGFLYDPVDLIEKITGNKPDASSFIDYLNDKFSKIYEF
ncbi:MAG: carboxypeptidase M32 [archaeon]|nr:carboxypeptidase M32 [archaeon]